MGVKDGEPIIRFEAVHKRYGDVEVLVDINLGIFENTFISFVGPSGCGKSTMLNMIAGFVQPSEGCVFFREKEIRGINTRVGYVPQESKLYPWMTLERNIRYPLEVRGIPPAERDRIVREYIDLVGLTGFEKHYPHQLSGGMQKRASLIRTMVYDPEVILMDEPFGPLDAQTRMVLQDELLRIWAERRKTILFVTHDLVEAIALSDYIVVFTNRPTRIGAIVDVKIPRPRNVFEIHQMEGFDATFSELWRIFRHELKLSAVGR